MSANAASPATIKTKTVKKETTTQSESKNANAMGAKTKSDKAVGTKISKNESKNARANAKESANPKSADAKATATENISTNATSLWTMSFMATAAPVETINTKTSSRSTRSAKSEGAKVLIADTIRPKTASANTQSAKASKTVTAQFVPVICPYLFPPRLSKFSSGSYQAKCKWPVKPGYNYCCAKHDPEYTAIFSPDDFGQYGLRRLKEGTIVKLYNGMDPYHKETLPEGFNTENVHLDHIFGKQMISHTFNQVATRCSQHHRRDQLNDLVKLFRDDIVNEDSNLTLTKAQTNCLKGAGCWKFLDDLTTGHFDNRGFTSYLLAAHRKENSCRLQRKETGRICKAIYDSAQYILYKLDGENDNDLLKDELDKELQEMIAAMQLKSHKPIATCRSPRRGAFSKRASMDTSGKQDATSSAQAANEPPVTVSAAGGGSRRHWSQRDTTRRKSLALKPSAFSGSTGVVGVVLHANAPTDDKDGAAKHPPLVKSSSRASRASRAGHAIARFGSQFFFRCSSDGSAKGSHKKTPAPPATAEERCFWPRRFATEKKIAPDAISNAASPISAAVPIATSAAQDDDMSDRSDVIATTSSLDVVLRSQQQQGTRQPRKTSLTLVVNSDGNKSSTHRSPQPTSLKSTKAAAKSAQSRPRIATPALEPSTAVPSFPLASNEVHPPFSPQFVLQTSGHELTAFEKIEVLQYGEIYVYGSLAVKSRRRDGRVHENAPPTQATAAEPPSLAATKSSVDLFNDGYDDERGDYLVLARDHIAYRFEVLHMLGGGSFGQVVCCLDHQTQQHVAVKIIRNRQKYKEQSLIEVQILSQLQRACRHRRPLATATTGAGEPRIVAMREYFLFRNHLCIAFELLGINLYEYLKLRFFQGLPMDNIRGIASQLVVTLALLKAQRVVHCDLKPENVLIRPSVKTAHGSSKVMLPIMQSATYANAPVDEICLIDFGSSCLESAPVFTYIQSRFYRSPEVILWYPYSTAIDMWSFACILVELYTGHPLFAGENETEQLARIMEICGVPSQEFLSHCKRWKHFFSSSSDTTSSELPERFEPKPFVNSRGRKRTPGSRSLVNAIKCDHHADFLAFLKKCFVLDPRHRMTPDQALRDPWFQNHHRAGVDGSDDNSTNSRTNSSVSQEITGL